jgi:hypothetical protein
MLGSTREKIREISCVSWGRKFFVFRSKKIVMFELPEYKSYRNTFGLVILSSAAVMLHLLYQEVASSIP